MPMLAGLMLLLATPSAASPVPEAPAFAPQPVKVEYYYRIKWGSMAEFDRLYEKNHAPLLRELQKQGFILSIVNEAPFTHMAGGARWDLRVTIVYRDADAAVGRGGPFDAAYGAAMKTLWPDSKTHAREEAQRFALIEEHWDVIVNPVE
jgi:hypothetical protein